MDRTELELLSVKGKALSQPYDPQLRTWLLTQLGTLAMCRQAMVDAETLKFFAASLSSFDPKDLSAAIEKLCHTRREPGETAFPDLPTLEEAVEIQCNARRKREREEDGRRFAEAETKRRAEHPEEYVTMAEIYAAVEAAIEAKRKANAPKPISIGEAEYLTPEHRVQLINVLENKNGGAA